MKKQVKVINHSTKTNLFVAYVIIILILLTGCHSAETSSEESLSLLSDKPIEAVASTIEESNEQEMPESEEPAKADFVEREILVDNNSKQVVDDYFNHSVFVGDSVLRGLELHVLSNRKKEPTLGNAKFLTSVNFMRLADCTGDTPGVTVYYQYKGSQRNIYECVGDMDVSKVFIMLGINDLQIGSSIPDTIERYNKTLDKLYEVADGIEIIVLLPTPRTASPWRPDYCINENFDNNLIDEFVTEIKTMCNKRGYKYVELNKYLKGSDNALPEAYSSDNYVHVNSTGAAIMVNALHEFAKGMVDTE